jgi:hypothetical protein
MNHPLKKPLVLCEGKEDKLVMLELAKRAGVEGRMDFEAYNGKDRLRDYLSLLKVRPEYTRGEHPRVLVTRDADNNFDHSWQALSTSVSEGLACTVEEPGKWCKTTEGTEIAAWIVPGVGQTGMIETMCVNSSEGKAPDVFGCLESFLHCLKGADGSDMHEKARFAIWTIAAQGIGAKDRMSLEYAIPNLPIDWDAEIFQPLKDLLISVAG